MSSLSDSFTGCAARLFHLEDKSAILYVDLAAPEGRTVAAKRPVLALQPAALIKRVEVVLPVLLELARLRIVLLNLDVVVASVPGHTRVVEIVTPARERRQPEVHHEVLVLGLELDIRSVLGSAHHVTVDEPLDVVRCPLNDVIVPICAGLEPGAVRLVLLRPFPNVHAHWVSVNRRHNFNIYLVLALLRPVRSVPVGEERADGARLAAALDPRREAGVRKRLDSLDFPAPVVCICRADKHDQSSCKTGTT